MTHSGHPRCIRALPSTSGFSKVDRCHLMRHLVGQGLIDQAQEFLPRGRTVTEAAQHPTGDKVRVRFVHPARGHAMMGCL
jgi:hypothetical protein